MPGIENLAPDRTDTSSGSSASPSLLPHARSRVDRCSSTSSAARLAGAGGQVGAARFRADGEARWHGQPQLHHLGQVGALAPEQVLLVLVSF